MIKKHKLPTIIAVLILAIGVIAGTLALNSATIFKLGASPDSAPQDVRITNIGDTILTISWITQKSVVGFVQYGETASLGQNTTATETPSTTHWVNVTGLRASTSYFFKINSDGTVYDNAGIPWTTGTGGVAQGEPTAQIISGNITQTSGQGAPNVIVYITAQNASPVSVLTTSTGSWTTAISKTRTTDLTNFVTLTPSTPLQIFVQAGPLGIASAQVLLQNANPTPPIQLGGTFDFRESSNNNTASESGVPSANITIPENTSTQSGTQSFNLGNTSTSSGTIKVVTVDSVKEGEVIATSSPQFFGKGPASTKITLTVQSQIVSGTVTTTSIGSWNWTPPTDLEQGIHKLTVSWKDAKGILQTITRDFTVEASGGNPSFVSTPSGTASPSARHSLPATTSAIPVSGDLTPTLMVSIMGVGLIILSIYIWKKI